MPSETEPRQQPSTSHRTINESVDEESDSSYTTAKEGPTPDRSLPSAAGAEGVRFLFRELSTPSSDNAESGREGNPGGGNTTTSTSPIRQKLKLGAIQLDLSKLKSRLQLSPKNLTKSSDEDEDAEPMDTGTDSDVMMRSEPEEDDSSVISSPSENNTENTSATTSIPPQPPVIAVGSAVAVDRGQDDAETNNTVVKRSSAGEDGDGNAVSDIASGVEETDAKPVSDQPLPGKKLYLFTVHATISERFSAG